MTIKKSSLYVIAFLTLLTTITLTSFANNSVDANAATYDNVKRVCKTYQYTYSPAAQPGHQNHDFHDFTYIYIPKNESFRYTQRIDLGNDAAGMHPMEAIKHYTGGY